MTPREVDGLGAPVAEYLQHGLGVTSAALFGSLTPDGILPVPFAKIDHWRVLDVFTTADSHHGYLVVLRRIQKILSENKYDFVSCSLGPDEPIDSDVNPWTAVFDDLNSSGKTNTTVAVGNNGEADQEVNLHLTQPPGDASNVTAVGACDNLAFMWGRASYSAIGAHRTPGMCKPDGLAFGGTSDDPYWVPSLSNPGQSFAVMGTSFAAPSVMRAAVGVRAAFGPETDALVLKALHIHKTERAGHLPQTHQGWGRFCTIVPELVECVDSSYTVIYKGTIAPKRYLRLDVAVLPRFTGQVDLKATLCFAAQVDPQNAASYTRAAVDIVFRKNKLDIPEGKTTPPPSPFFGLVSGMTEAQRRADARKWEVTQHADQRYEDGGELVSPVFDLHYVPREDGRDDDDAPEIPFAMIISVSAPNHPKAHRDIEQRYTGVMNQLKPVIDLNLYV